VCCEVTEKGGSWASNLYREGIRQISDMHFQIALISEHVASFG